MSNVTQTVQNENSASLPGITTASLLVVTLVSTAAGALTGLALEDVVSSVVLAVLAGLTGTLAAGLVRNTLPPQASRTWERRV